MSRNLKSGMATAMALALLVILPAVAGDSQGDRVIVTKPGVVFHKAGAGDIRGHAVERSIDSALEAGYAPCPVCFAKEISLARSGSPEVAGGAATASFGTESIPAPPVSTVAQPFGIQYVSQNFTRGRKDGIRNPYEAVHNVRPGAFEQGAFGDR